MSRTLDLSAHAHILYWAIIPVLKVAVPYASGFVFYAVLAARASIYAL
jgi:hypothetical protein